MQIICKASDIVEAHIVSGMLNANGIKTYVGGHYLQGAIGDLSPLGFANVFVADEDIELALSIIKDYEQDAYSSDADFIENIDLSNESI